ncbi:MAG: hypothetical protein A2057_12995 [Ignavibacteria bacterium GWA2_35_9]|nr:MAG: hypothetical protein A2057_12995 [Ignavibacteria bacterium GWA2_35_9]OGU43071.1 MAG: hypothetical protein A2000_03280 [Ignavibacteria bacterium GWB2_36_8]OGV04854.1 MAG: hypothetical protein A2330_02815 [Ignavibacteria bacterium RIFOXYB2_FULL_36_7]
MITDKLMRLEENLKTLKQLKKNYTLDDFISDKVDEWGLRYGLLESIQIIIDLACHIVAEKNLGTPKNYSECISFLISNNYLKKGLGEKITQMIGLRNLLIHEYGIVEVKKLFEYLNHINDISDFIYAIRKV